MNISTLPNMEEVVAFIRQCSHVLEETRCPLYQSLYRTLREPVCAPEDQPRFDHSSVDGYAIRLDDSGQSFSVVDRIRAGEWKPRKLEPGQAVQIATGGALPGDGLRVVMKEDIQLHGDHLELKENDARRNIRFRGENAKAGQTLVEAGTVLQPGTLALLASVGHTQPLVTRLPRVLHAASGNEIVPPEQSPQSGQIRDSNSILVRTFLNQWRIEPRHLYLPEDEMVARKKLAEEKAAEVDLLLISGGASVGEYDFTRRLLEFFGYQIRLSKSNIRPGKPMIFATRGNSLAFGLPGNPLAHFVCLNLFIRPALENQIGAQPYFARSGVLASDLDHRGGSSEILWPARSEQTTAGTTLHPLRWSNSGDLTALASANALIHVPADSTNILNGNAVKYYSTQIFS